MQMHQNALNASIQPLSLCSPLDPGQNWIFHFYFWPFGKLHNPPFKLVIYQKMSDDILCCIMHLMMPNSTKNVFILIFYLTGLGENNSLVDFWRLMGMVVTEPWSPICCSLCPLWINYSKCLVHWNIFYGTWTLHFLYLVLHKSGFCMIHFLCHEVHSTIIIERKIIWILINKIC